jgi:histone H3/H4
MNSSSGLNDTLKFQKILKELSSKNDPSGQKVCDIDAQAVLMFKEYLQEISCSIIEEASLLSKHRGADIIDSQDINFIFGEYYYVR